MSDKLPGIWRRPYGLWFWFVIITLLTYAALCWLNRFDADDTFYLVAGIAAGTVGFVFIWAFLFVRWLCCWRNFRRFLIVTGCFAALVAAFYIEENWRGQRAWENYKREGEAKGEKFKLTELAPPPVPDDQNFAMTPIVASCYSGQIDRHGHQLVPANTNVVNRLEMNLYREGEYPDNLRSNSWQKAIPTDLKVWQQYYRTPPTNSVTNEFPIAAQPQIPAADVLLALSKYDSIIEELRQASQLPYSRFPLAYDNENPSVILLPHLARLKVCVRTMQLRTSAELQLNQTEQALADVKLALRLADSIRNEPILINHLVRIAIFQITLQSIWEGLAEHRWSASQLVELERELQKEDFLADFQFAMRGERAYGITIVEFLRKKITNRRLLFDGCVLYSEEPSEFDKISSRIGKYVELGFWFMIPDGWFYQNELASAKIYQTKIYQTCSTKSHLAFPRRTKEADQFVDKTAVSPSDFLARLFTQALCSKIIKFAFAQGSVDLARVAIALERHRLAQGNYPATLDALAPQFLAQVPHDVIGGQPLHYRREADGQFVLYSIGWNEKDDGGVFDSEPYIMVGNSNTGYSGSDMKTGDWVWRYPAAAR